jgi:MFS family permease
LTGAATCFGVAMLFDAVAPHLGLELPALMVTGAASIMFFASANAMLQLISRPEMRGRVMAIYMLLFLGSTPIGGPIVGWIGSEWSARWSLAVGAVACLAAAAVALPAVIRRHRSAPVPVEVAAMTGAGNVGVVAVAAEVAEVLAAEPA